MKPRTKRPNSSSDYLWNWKQDAKTSKSQNRTEFPVIRFLRQQTQNLKDKAAGPGIGAGLGCGAGVGFGLVGGLGFGGGGWNQMNVVFGVGLGCGVGFGFGYGQGIGGGFSLQDIEDYLFPEKGFGSGKKILTDY